jgi:hypothetical protein
MIPFTSLHQSIQFQALEGEENEIGRSEAGLANATGACVDEQPQSAQESVKLRRGKPSDRSVPCCRPAISVSRSASRAAISATSRCCEI